MLAATQLPTPEEREAALELVPRVRELFDLAGFARGALMNQAVGLIDAALGPGHTRAALVTLQEGIDVLLQATIDLVGSSVNESVLARVETVDPLSLGEEIRAQDRPRLPARAARFGVEDAAVRTASAGDHLANAYLRLAYEANAALPEEVRRCGFVPEQLLDPSWTGVNRVRSGLRAINAQAGVLAPTLPAFELTDDFNTYATSQAVVDAWEFRDVIIHRERPSYREAPGLGRVTAWRGGQISFQHPPSDEELHALPTLADRRSQVAGAIDATHAFAESAWEIALRFLRSVDVWITRPDDDEVSIQTEHRVGPPDLERPRPIPREKRDPGPFLH
jgi:hypothetical protein